MNISLAISQGSKILRNKFIPNSQLDSEILMAKTINKDRNFILLNSKTFLNKKDLNNFNMLIKKRSLGTPVAHLINQKPFWNSEFFITNDTLIPRPDTELVVENILRITKLPAYIFKTTILAFMRTFSFAHHERGQHTTNLVMQQYKRYSVDGKSGGKSTNSSICLTPRPKKFPSALKRCWIVGQVSLFQFVSTITIRYA